MIYIILNCFRDFSIKSQSVNAPFAQDGISAKEDVSDANGH